MAPPLTWALAYARRGWRVHPLYEVDPQAQRCACWRSTDCPDKQRGKHPRLPGWQKEATTDEAQVRAWWGRWPSASVGLATGAASGVWVLDLDGPEAIAWYAEQERRHGEVQTVGIRTSRGVHLYWSWVDGVPIRNTQALVPGVDVRGDGGYVVAPPSMHRSGHVYAVMRGDGWSSQTTPAPSWLVEMVREKPKPVRRVEAPRWALTERELSRHLRGRLDVDVDLRVAVGRTLGGTYREAARAYVDDIPCPRCRDREVWYYADGGPAVCHHRNSCGWAGSVDALRRQGHGVLA